MKKRYPGLNIQWPWSKLITQKKKTVETRNYPLSKHKLNTPICLIETKGVDKNSPVKKARITALIQFTDCYPYTSKTHWKKEHKKHKVPINDKKYKYQKTKWGWKLKVLKVFKTPKKAPSKKGIIWAKNCKI